MGIVYPDNDNRQTRLIELSTDTSDSLYQAATDYSKFTTLVSEVNQQIADLYRTTNLEPPPVDHMDVLRQAGVLDDIHAATSFVDASKILSGVLGLAGACKYLAPGATRLLVSTGAMAEVTAQKVLVQTIPLVGWDIELTVGKLAGNVIGSVVTGVAVFAVDLGIDAIEGAQAKTELVTSPHQLFGMRAGVNSPSKRLRRSSTLCRPSKPRSTQWMGRESPSLKQPSTTSLRRTLRRHLLPQTPSRRTRSRRNSRSSMPNGIPGRLMINRPHATERRRWLSSTLTTTVGSSDSSS